MLKERMIEWRKRVEEELRKLVWGVYVPEIKIYAMICGCIGLYVDTRGLYAEDVEVFGVDMMKLLSEMGKSFGIRPDIIFARKLPGSEEVVVLNVRQLCDVCKYEYGSTVSPRPDIIMLVMNL